MSDFECGICISEIKNNKDKFLTPCAHKFCNECFNKWNETLKKSNKKSNCPICRTLISYNKENISDITGNLPDIKDWIIQNCNTFNSNFYKKHRRQILSSNTY